MNNPDSPVAFRPVVLMPTYNNAGTLEAVMNGVAGLNLPIMVVDDGSTDGTATVLARWDGRAIRLRHPVNRGKAAALRTGFSEALANGFTHAATIDTDGQLDPSQLPGLLRCSQERPRALTLGVRSWEIANCPPKNVVARRLSNAAIRLQCGVRIQDSQCGLRVYPLDLMRHIRVKSNRYSFEAEAITHSVWAGCPVVQVPIQCSYAPEGERVSHFDPWRDTTRGVLRHLAALARSLTPWPHRPWRN